MRSQVERWLFWTLFGAAVVGLWLLIPYPAQAAGSAPPSAAVGAVCR